VHLMTSDPRRTAVVKSALKTARDLGLPSVLAVAALAAQMTGAVTLPVPAPARAPTAHIAAATAEAWQDNGYFVVGTRLCYAWSEDRYRCAPARPSATSNQARIQEKRVVATPAARPRPTRKAPVARPAGGTTPGRQAIINEILAVFGRYGNQAVNVARCESGFDPNAINPASHASGLFQFLPSTWRLTSYASMSPFNASANIHAAYQVFSRDGYSWREWSCKP
jgi:hypothetical protein